MRAELIPGTALAVGVTLIRLRRLADAADATLSAELLACADALQSALPDIEANERRTAGQ